MSLLPPGFGYVAGALFTSWFIHHGWMPSKVMAARKKFNVPYPTLYATDKEVPNDEDRKKYNCFQRAHQNSLENQPIILAMMVTVGLEYPIFAASCGMIYNLGRMFYFNGYSTGSPEKRLQGSFLYFGLLGLLGGLGKMTWKALTA